MSIQEIILFLRAQLLQLRDQNDREAAFELLGTLKTLTRLSVKNQDKELTAILVELTDAARCLYQGEPVNGAIPPVKRIQLATSTAQTKDSAEPAAAVAVAGGRSRQPGS
jgi:hypothetical protein